MNEFDAISKFFAPLSFDGLKNDGAVLAVPDGYELVITSDTLNESVHFPDDENPQLVAHKALRVNLSDLASMGAEPYAYQLNLALPERIDAGWLESFSKALKRDQDTFKIKLSGGDTTGTKGPLSISITAMGLVPRGKAISRNGAKEGDAIIITGTIGDATIGLEALLGHGDFEGQEKFLERYRLPQPRCGLAKILQAHAHAAIDVSDGLIADLGHICSWSQLGATLQVKDIPLSEHAHKAVQSGKVKIEKLLTGGDDYELAIAVPAAAADEFCKLAKKAGIPAVQAGIFTKGDGIKVLDESGRALVFETVGWQHF